MRERIDAAVLDALFKDCEVKPSMVMLPPGMEVFVIQNDLPEYVI